jgi:hypothetical protein
MNKYLIKFLQSIGMFCLSFLATNGIAQSDYWQQYLSYTINVQLDEKGKTLAGGETIVYRNYSPDTLNFIWFHLYPNAYKNESTALYQQILNVDSRKDKILNTKKGDITNLSFKVNNTVAKTEAHTNSQYSDVVKLILNKPLLPGDSISISTPFTVQLPSYFSRSGFEDGEFMVCQWYPKPAVYDKDGWHEMPYLDMGEFYSEYGDYKVTITLPAEYVVAATGILSTPSEDSIYKSVGRFNATNRNEKNLKIYTPFSGGKMKTLTYYADSVPDFAWFADKSFIIQYDTVKLQSGKAVNAFTFFHNQKKTPWVNSIDFVKDAVRQYSKWIGEYAYPVVQAVEGPKNNSSGGMEYPTVTLITSPDAKPEYLDGVIAHEVGHNWFMSILGTNEREYAWMDEGLNTYFQFRYEAEKYRANGIFGDRIPADVKKLNEDNFQMAVYNSLMQIPIESPINTTSTGFKNSEDYGLTAYIKTAEWMYLLEKAIGRDKVDSAFQNYFSKWKFKHPQPADLKISFEEAIQGNLSDYFKLLDKRNKLVE